jgi:hypothetical protein
LQNLFRSVLVENVFLDTREKVIKVEINWYGGTITEILVPKYIFTSGHIYHRIKDLAIKKTDRQIAEELNGEGLKTVKGHNWTARRVMDFRLSNKIASSFTTSKKMRIPDSGYLSSDELATNLKVKQTTIQKWFKTGILDGHKDGGRCQLWIKANEKTIERLNGTSSIDHGCVSLKRLMAERKEQTAEVVAWAKNEGNEILRVRRGNTYRFYIRPKEPEKKT